MGSIQYLRHPLNGGNTTRTPEYPQGTLIGKYVRLPRISFIELEVVYTSRGTYCDRCPNPVTIPAFGHVVLTIDTHIYN